MRTLIVPCAGSRMIGNLPLFLNVHPNKQLLAIKAISGVFPERYDKIIFTILKQTDEKYHAREIITKANNGKYDIDFIILDVPTSGPAETIYQTLIMADIKDEFSVRDSHVYLSVNKDYTGNFVAGLDLTKYEKPIENLRGKSFMSINEQGQILDIVEKHFCSDIISAGYYGFKSASDYKRAYEHLTDSNYEIQKLYLSHVISYLIGYSQRVFHRAKVLEFEDWSTSTAWQKVQKHNSLCLIDLDSIDFNDKVKMSLVKLSGEGMSFVGYSCHDISKIDYCLEGINFISLIPNCPCTNSKTFIDCAEDIEKMFLEI